MKDSDNSFSQRLRKLRKEKGLSVKDVAQRINVPVTTYREWEHGRKIVGEPYVELSKVFEVSVYELITGEKNTNSEALNRVETIESEIKKIKEILLSI